MNATMRLAAILVVAVSSWSARALTCVDSIRTQQSDTSKTTMTAGTIVGFAAGALEGSEPRLTFVFGEVGCEYGEMFSEAWKENKMAVAIFGSLYVFTKTEISEKTQQYLIQYMGKVEEKARENVDTNGVKASDVVVTPTLLTASKAAEIAEKNGIDGSYVTTAILLMNPTGAVIELATGNEAKKVVDQAGSDIATGCKKVMGKLVKKCW